MTPGPGTTREDNLKDWMGKPFTVSRFIEGEIREIKVVTEETHAALLAEVERLRGLLDEIGNALVVALPPPNQWPADGNPNASSEWGLKNGDVVRLSDSLIAIQALRAEGDGKEGGS